MKLHPEDGKDITNRESEMQQYPVWGIRRDIDFR